MQVIQTVSARRILKSSIFMLTLAVLVGAIYLSFPVRPVSHDELEHIHASFLLSKGLIPIRDFFECHFPTPWIFISSFLSFQSPPSTLFEQTRVVAAIFHLLFVASIYWISLQNVRLSVGALITLLSLPLIYQSTTVAYLTSSRLDSLAYFLTLLSLVFMICSKARSVQFLMAFATTIGHSFTPKFALFSVIGCGLIFVERYKHSRHAALSTLAFQFAGAITGLAVICSYFSLHNVALADAYYFILGSHAKLNASLSGVEIFDGIKENLFTIAGLWCLGSISVIVQWRKFSAFERVICGTVALFIPAQLLTVRLPYEQYVAPLLVLTICLLRPLSLLATQYLSYKRFAALPLTCAALLAWYCHGSLQPPEALFAKKETHLEILDQLSTAIHPDSRVVAPVVFHPLTRLDSLYLWVFTTTLDSSASLTEELFKERPFYGPRFTAEAYFNELSAKPPDAIVLSSSSPWKLFSRPTAVALSRYLQERDLDYKCFANSFVTVLLREKSAHADNTKEDINALEEQAFARELAREVIIDPQSHVQFIFECAAL